MRNAFSGMLIGAIAGACLPWGASALSITYVVDRTLSPSVQGGTMTVVGTVTVDDTGPTVTDWDLTIASSEVGQTFTLEPSNSTFISQNTTLTATPAQLTIDTGVVGVFGAQLRDDATSLRHEWFLAEEQGFGEQASLDFADPDTDFDFVNIPRANPIVLVAVPEPATLFCVAVALAGLASTHGRRPSPRG